VKGVYFAVWAPNAIRVSVVGAFNAWDGRRYPMNRLDSGIFELFIPGLAAGRAYRYEILKKGGETYLKSDPFAGAFEEGAEGASLVSGESRFAWGDGEWMTLRGSNQDSRRPMVLYQTKFSDIGAEEGAATYREKARLLAKHCRRYGYTHVELTPVTEYPIDETDGFEVSGYFAPTSRYGSPDDFRYLVDHLHRMGIGVIVDVVDSYFASGNSLLAEFDGTCLYEHLDPRRGIHPAFGTHIFNYGRGEVVSFLIASAVNLAQNFHIDGLKMTDTATMLYRNYGRKDGEWVANLYGGSENLEAIEFLKKLNRVVHRLPGFLTIAEDMAGWNGITLDEKQDGLGFDYRWDNEWSDDFLEYMRLDPLFRGSHHDELTMHIVYAWSEKALRGFGRDQMSRKHGGLISLMSGLTREQKEANERLALSYLFVYPGKKLLAAGEADAAPDLEKEEYAARREKLIKKLTAMCEELPALYENDLSPEGFEWISNLDSARNLLIFLRKGSSAKDTLLVVCNFSNVEYDEFLIGVPRPGKYKEIFNSDAEEYGGTGAINPRVRMSRPVEHDERPQSICVCVPPLAVSIYRYTGEEKQRSSNRQARKRPASKQGLKSELARKVAEEGD
jgi:1,4-alpha-glucan branching enzyme